MILVAAGDSFIWGVDLPDCASFESAGYSRNTFPALLSTQNNYTCIARPGNSNDAIARSVVNYVEQNIATTDIIFVTWTFAGRYEFRLNNNWHSINSWMIDKHQCTVSEHAKKLGIYEFSNTYFKHVGSNEYWEIYTMLKEIVYLQNYLDLKNVKYLFTCVDASFLDSFTLSHPDITISSLYNQINFDHWYLFPGRKGFVEWATANKYTIGDTQHPLDDAHRDAAELIKERFNELVIQYDQQN